MLATLDLIGEALIFNQMLQVPFNQTTLNQDQTSTSPHAEHFECGHVMLEIHPTGLDANFEKVFETWPKTMPWYA
jgi:hypothetical protein